MKYQDCSSYQEHGIPNHMLDGTVYGIRVHEGFDTFEQLNEWLDEHELNDQAFFNGEFDHIQLEHEWRPVSLEEDKQWADFLDRIEEEMFA